MPKKQEDTLGFDFQVIDLAAAHSMVLSGDGRYSALRAHILEAIPKLPEGQAYVFGNKGVKVDPKVKSAIIATINKTFKTSNLSWKISYSKTRMLFVCVPKVQAAQTEVPIRRNSSRLDPERLATARSLIQKTASIIGIDPDQLKSTSIESRRARAVIINYLHNRGYSQFHINTAMGMKCAYYAMKYHKPDNALLQKVMIKMNGGKNDRA